MSSGPKKYERWTETELAAITTRVDLRTIIGKDVKLKREGSNICVGLSPFTNEKTGSFKVWAANYHCFSSGRHGDLFSWLIFSRGLSFVQAVKEGFILAGLENGKLTASTIKETERVTRERDEDAAAREKRMIKYAADIVAKARPWQGSLVETYLSARGLLVDDAMRSVVENLYFHPHLKNRSGEVFRAMVAAVRLNDKVDAPVVGAHVTFLKDDGSWYIDTKSGPTRNGKFTRAAKQMYGPVFGRAAQLITPTRPLLSNGKLSIGEGIESTLAGWQLTRESLKGISGGAYWAGLSLGNMTGAQMRDERGNLLFDRRTKIRGVVVAAPPGLPRGVPIPDLDRPAFLPPEGFRGSVRILAEDDLKDDPKSGVSGTQRAREAYNLACAKFRMAGRAKSCSIAWPPAGCDMADILFERAEARAAELQHSELLADAVRSRS